MQSDKEKLKIIIFAIIFLASLILGGRYFLLRGNKPPETYVAEIKDAIREVEKEAETKNANTKENISLKENQPDIIPEKIFVKTPFISQAPFGVWDERHEEACEETALLILKYYLDKKPLSKDSAEAEIQKMINFEVEKYGNYKDSNVEQVIKLAQDFYGLENLAVVYDFKKEDIKKELAKGKPIIVPAAGRELNNPYFTQPGPLYHMLVLIGYSGDQIITNDPGTRRGEGYRYNIDILYNAIHDFPGKKEQIKEGRKAMIVIK